MPLFLPILPPVQAPQDPLAPMGLRTPGVDDYLQGLNNLIEDYAGPDGPRGDAEVQESYRVERIDQDGMTLVRYLREVRGLQAEERDTTWSFRWSDLRGLKLDREAKVNGAIRVSMRFRTPVKAKVETRFRAAGTSPRSDVFAKVGDETSTSSDLTVPITFEKRDYAIEFLSSVGTLSRLLKVPLENPATTSTVQPTSR